MINQITGGNGEIVIDYYLMKKAYDFSCDAKYLNIHLAYQVGVHYIVICHLRNGHDEAYTMEFKFIYHDRRRPTHIVLNHTNAA